MKGNNTLTLSEEAMIVAVQEYLDARFKKDAPVVKSVKAEKERNAYGRSNEFVVELCDARRLKR